MKKKIATIIGLLLIFFVSGVYASDTMWAEKYLTWISGYSADHVYVVVNNNGTEESFAFHGGDSGGSYLTNTYGWGDYYKVSCTYNYPQSCKVTYLFNGICHQDANRLLYSNGKDVFYAQGYLIFAALYGDYGNLTTWGWCKDMCNL